MSVWTASEGPLRQGDICELPAYPLWDVERSSRQVGASELTEGYTIPRHKAMEWDPLAGTVAVAICSHDCDLENPRERTGIIIAPLIRVPARVGDPRHEAIMASGDTSSQIHYTHLFPVRYETAAGDEMAAVIDFSALTSMAKSEPAIAKLSRGKKLECDDETRVSIGRKIALFLGRPYQAPR